MAEGFVTLIPVYTTASPEDGGAVSFFGWEHIGLGSGEVVGLLPVIVADRMIGHGSKRVLEVWREFFTWLFINDPGEDFLSVTPDSVLRNRHLAESVHGAMSSGAESWTRSMQPSVPGFERCAYAYLVRTLVLPRRVVSSPCQKCAQDGGWVLSPAWATYPMDVGRIRWNLQMPPEADSSTAWHSHSVEDRFSERCRDLWMESRELWGPEYKFMSYEEMISVDEEEGGAIVDELDDEAMKSIAAEIAMAHQALWFPPPWLLDHFTNSMSPVWEALQKDRLAKRFIARELLGDPYDCWDEGLSEEFKAR